ncbi:MAG: hypothetical protein COA47_14390 [Robiginitomaculum sp.]|nr:MAG: hypothetical protein COA47_14390 [Robiginitomaculum sp.]
MWDRKSLTLRKYSQFSAIILVAVAFISSGKEAAALTADEVLNRMTPEQSATYVNGIIEGLATARWLQDRPNAEGMNCIYDWYYQQPNSAVWNRIIEWFERHPEQQAGALMAVLIKPECGE